MNCRWKQKILTRSDIALWAVFGATGTIGDGLLKAAINDPDIEKIHVVTRRPSPRIESGVSSGKVEMTIHLDYTDYSALMDILKDVDTVFWAIGLSAVGLDEDTYKEIHNDFPVRFVTAWQAVNSDAELSFHYVSGAGASADSRIMWAREKARAEQELTKLGEGTNLRVISYRPSFITPTETELNLGHKFLHAILSPIKSVVRAESIGYAMIEASARSQQLENGSILENRDILGYSEAYEKRSRSR